MAADEERYWLRECGSRALIVGLAPIVAATAIFVVMVLFSDSAAIALEIVAFVVAAPALAALGLLRNSVTVHTRTGAIVRRRFLQSERIDAKQRLRVDIRRDPPLTYVFIRSLDGVKTFDVLCDSNVVVWRSRPKGSTRPRRLRPPTPQT